MKAKYKEVQQRLKKHMEDCGGVDSWKDYQGSQMEVDVILFVEKELEDYKEITKKSLGSG